MGGAKSAASAIAGRRSSGDGSTASISGITRRISRASAVITFPAHCLTLVVVASR
jgi:hypothetical protein